MERSVVATCPGCAEQLRIPAQWADKAVKCKKCGAVVRAKGPAPTAAPAPVPGSGPLPVAAAVVPKPNGTPPAAPPWPVAPAAGPAPAPVAPYPYPAAPAAPPAGAMPPVFDPATGTWVPGATTPGYPYPAAPGYPYPAAPGYPAPPAGYPYPPAGYAPPGYGPPPSYPYPPAAGRPKDAFAGMEEQPVATRRRGATGRKKGGGNVGVFVLLGFIGVGLLSVIGAGVWAAFNQDKVAALFGRTPPDTGSTDKEKPTDKGGTAAAKGGTPRRMLALSVTKYLYANPLVGGKNRNGASEFNEAVKGIAFRYQVPDSKDNNQLYVVTDADGKLMQSASPRPMLKGIILDAVAKFCQSSRKQDRMVIYFGGHALAKDGKAYLIPAEGDPNEVDSLIPLDDVWALLATCPAQQKVVLFDVCRLSTDDNAIRPGSEPMTEELEKALHSPPAGVQVVTSCSAGQTTGEFRAAEDADTPQGSAFLGALRRAARKSTVKVGPTDPFPVDEWVKESAARMKDVLGPTRPATPKASGEATPLVDVDPDEAAPERFTVAEAPKGANPKDVQQVFAVLATPPLLGGGEDKDDVQGSVFFPEDALKDYKPDVPVDEIEKMGEKLPPRVYDITPAQWKELKGQAHRVAAVKALAEVRAKWAKFAGPEKDSILKDGLNGKVDDKLKADIEKREQPPIADAALELSELVETLTDEKLGLQKAGEEDPDKFWQATFRFALAQAKLRLAFIHEANLALGNVRTENLPDSASGLRLVQKAKMTDKKAAPGGKQALEQLGELAAAHKGTPFEVLAKQWRAVSLGLEWRPKKEDADTTAEMKEEKK